MHLRNPQIKKGKKEQCALTAARGWPLADCDLWQVSVTSHLCKTSSVIPMHMTSHAHFLPPDCLFHYKLNRRFSTLPLWWQHANLPLSELWEAERRGLGGDEGTFYRLGGSADNVITGRLCSVTFFFFLLSHAADPKGWSWSGHLAGEPSLTSVTWKPPRLSLCISDA